MYGNKFACMDLEGEPGGLDVFSRKVQTCFYSIYGKVRKQPPPNPWQQYKHVSMDRKKVLYIHINLIKIPYFELKKY